MRRHWQVRCKNVSTPLLEKAWGEMALIFNRHIAGEVDNQWSILPLPTGTGKTQGLALYCAMLSKKKFCPGVLIVTGLTDEADDLAKLINDLAGNPKAAIARHSKKEEKDSQATIRAAPVLIVTHSAYSNALEAVSQDKRIESNWDMFNAWNGGTRKLTVIDEALNIVEDAQVKIDDLRFLRGIIPHSLAMNFSNEIIAIDTVIDTLAKLASGDIQQETFTLMSFRDHEWAGSFDFNALAHEINKIPLSEFFPGVLEPKTAKILKAGFNKKHSNIIDNLSEVISDWCWYNPSGTWHTLNTARFILSNDIKSAVVLDATASENPIAKMLGKQFVLCSLPNGIKNYRDVTLYVSYGHNVSKTELAKYDKDHFYSILKGLAPRIVNRKKTLICVHKNTEEKHFKELLKSRFAVAHWGAINGLNKWNDCDTVIIYGLPYLGDMPSFNALMAFTHWLHKIEGTIYATENSISDAKYREDYELRHIIVSVVQAINRSHCRKVIEDGHCPQTDVYLYLNKREEDKITKAIARLMPGIKIKEWDAPIIGEAKKEKHWSKNEMKIIEFFDKAKPKTYRFDEVSNELGISERQLQRLANSTPLAQKLDEFVTKYHSGRGRNATRCFIKGKRIKSASLSHT